MHGDVQALEALLAERTPRLALATGLDLAQDPQSLFAHPTVCSRGLMHGALPMVVGGDRGVIEGEDRRSASQQRVDTKEKAAVVPPPPDSKALRRETRRLARDLVLCRCRHALSRLSDKEALSLFSAIHGRTNTLLLSTSARSSGGSTSSVAISSNVRTAGDTTEASRKKLHLVAADARRLVRATEPKCRERLGLLDDEMREALGWPTHLQRGEQLPWWQPKWRLVVPGKCNDDHDSDRGSSTTGAASDLGDKEPDDGAGPGEVLYVNWSVRSHQPPKEGQ